MSRLVAISEVAEVNPSFPKTENFAPDSLVSFLPMAAVSESGEIVSQDERPFGEVSKGYTYFAEGDVLMAKITPCMENGKATFVQNLKHPAGFGSTEFHVLRPGSEIDGKYLFYMIWNPLFRKVAGRNMTGTAGQKRVPSSFLRDSQISLPTLPEQKRIAAILDKADSIRRKRQEAVRLTEELLSSTFLDMFGDPETNPKSVKVVQLSEITTRITDGVHQKPNYTTVGVPFISVKDITTGTLKFDNCKFVSLEDHQMFTRRCKAEQHDILYTKVGATYGRPAIVDTDQEFSLYVSVCLIKPKRNLVDSFYLNAVLGTKAIKRQADQRIKGIGVPDLHLDQIQKLLIPLPEMEEQREFARRVATIEKLRTSHIDALSALDTLFNSLMQRTFNGEL
jgi:type I restriction enzyme S subunit